MQVLDSSFARDDHYLVAIGHGTFVLGALAPLSAATRIFRDQHIFPHDHYGTQAAVERTALA